MNPFTVLKNFSPFHFTSLHFTSLHFTSLHFTFMLFYFFTYSINPTFHFTLPFITTTHFPSPNFPSPFTFYRLHLPSLVFTFLSLVLKINLLPWEVPIAPSGSLFQSVMVLFTKQYFPMPVLCFLALIFQ